MEDPASQGDLADLGRRARRRAGAFAVDNAFRLLSRAGRLHPRARPAHHGIERLPDVPYLPDAAPFHRLDVYRPPGDPPWPVVLYLHGGGFRILSKDSHWLMGLAFARRGFLVLNANYRLAPANPYPAALEDAARAYAFVCDAGARYGGDPRHVVVAGESAGANLSTALTVAACFDRPEPWVRALEDLPVPAALLPACGVLQVTDPGRFSRRRRLPGVVQDRIDEVAGAYLGRADPALSTDLADPLCVLESGAEPVRPLPPTFAFAGTRDPLLDDTRRLGRALEGRGVPVEVRVYPGELHAFHAFYWRPRAKEAWRDTFAFLDGLGLGAPAGVPKAGAAEG